MQKSSGNGKQQNALQVEGIAQGSKGTARNDIDNAILSKLRIFPIVRVFQYTRCFGDSIRRAAFEIELAGIGKKC
jgi:hypothetical protein